MAVRGGDFPVFGMAIEPSSEFFYVFFTEVGNKHSVEQDYTGDLMGEIGLGDNYFLFLMMAFYVHHLHLYNLSGKYHQFC